jgi:hypothetical protein
MKRSAIEKAAERWGQVVVWDAATDTRRGAARQPSAFNTPVGQDLYSMVTESSAKTFVTTGFSPSGFQMGVWLDTPPSDPAADAMKFLLDTRAREGFTCPPEHRPGGGGLAS